MFLPNESESGVFEEKLPDAHERFPSAREVDGIENNSVLKDNRNTTIKVPLITVLEFWHFEILALQMLRLYFIVEIHDDL
jgi:hypothetical protein